jgi:hypothetical protein
MNHQDALFFKTPFLVPPAILRRTRWISLLCFPWDKPMGEVPLCGRKVPFN